MAQLALIRLAHFFLSDNNDQQYHYFTGYGFPLMILGLPFALATRFASARTQAEDLNTNLEKPTTVAEIDMKMAV